MADNGDVNYTTIGTHSGTFHCDEALACFLLTQLPEYSNAKIVRTRDTEVLKTCDVVVDVGGEYDPKRHRYDHHQREFNETLSSVRPDIALNKSIRLSSAGLVYAHFGLQVNKEILKRKNITVNRDCLIRTYMYIYDGFVEELDAIDNGVPMFPDGEPRYSISTHLSARVGRLNPEWNSPEPESIDELFSKAMALAGKEYTEKVMDAVTIWWPAREIVQKSLDKRLSVYSTGEIFILDEFCPWKAHLYSLEKELKIEGQPKFCLFYDTKGKSWRVQAIPVQHESFVCRVFLHKNWRGVRDDELVNVTGIKGCGFCHSTGFIGSNATKEGALEMAIQSLKAHIEDQK